MNNKELGRYGESVACQYLEKQNYKILERNFSCRNGEVDIIAKDGNEVVFCEVKTRRSLKFGLPCEAVIKQKQNHILAVSKYYLYKKRILNAAIRFDVIEVYLKNAKVYINQIKNAF